MNPAIIPDHQKKTYLKTFSEDDFRDKVVRPLFIMKGMRRGKDTCGVDEEGKDCYLYTDDSIRKDILYVIQTKKGDVKMSRRPSENLPTIIAQLNTALQTPVRDGKSKKKTYPSCVMLVASGEINKAAQSHIVDEIKDPHIEFKDADDLIPEIDHFMPEFWLGIDIKRLPYLRAFRDYLVNQSDTIDMTQLGIGSTVASPITEETFVQLYLYRFKEGIRRGSKDSLDVDEFPVQDLLTKPHILALIIAEAGDGKTTSLRRLAMILTELALKSTENKIIPVFLKAIEVARASGRLIDVTIESTQKLTGGSAAFEREDLVAGHVTLLLDGFDELATPEYRSAFTDKLSAFHKEFPKCRIILTSRNSPHLRMLEALNFTRYRISPINLKQVGRIIERISKGKELATHTTEEILRRLDNVHGIELNPLLVTVFVASTDYARSDIPANITELFKKFTEMMLGRWDQSKGLAQQYQATVKDFILSRVAFEMHKAGTTTLSTAEFNHTIQETLEERNLGSDIEILWDEIVNRSGLVRVEGNEVSFRHLLLQEFFAGRGIPSSEFMRSVLGQHWWMRAIVFYFGEKAGDEAALNALPAQLAEMKGTDLFQAAVTVGLAIQTCYLVKTDAKIGAMEWVVHSMASVFDDVIEWFRKDRPDIDVLPVAFYYLYGRDAVSGKVIVPLAERLLHQTREIKRGELTPYQERSLFWCLVGLLGMGEARRAEPWIRKFHPNDMRLLAPLLMGCVYLSKVQVALREEKNMAKHIAEHLGPSI